jgi:hypothetical protein
MMHDTHRHVPASRTRWIFIAFLAAAAVYLVIEHRAHLSGVPWLPAVVLLLCPLLHVFMHGGHGSHGRDASDAADAGTPGDSKDRDATGAP